MNASAAEVTKQASLRLKGTIQPPEWAAYVKTGTHKDRPPENPDWWYVRAASVLRRVNDTGPIGVAKLRVKYGGRKNRGVKPERFAKGSANIIRTILQQLEEKQLVKQETKGVHKGRVITQKGKKILFGAE
ncbi:MAG: 30S ribosomal protein S19e [Nanoarchaeota archaeon]